MTHWDNCPCCAGALRFRLVSLAAAGGVRLGQRQRRSGDPVRVLPAAHGALRPAAQLLRHGPADRQHLPGYVAVDRLSAPSGQPEGKPEQRRVDKGLFLMLPHLLCLS